MSLEEGLFIEQVERLPCIWDLKHPDHKNKIVLENAWTTIAAVSEMSVKDCEDLWKSLRIKYVRERKQIMMTPSGSAQYIGGWGHFKALGFLAPHIQTRRTKGNILKRKLDQNSGEEECAVWRESMIVGDNGFLETIVSEQEDNFSNSIMSPVSEDPSQTQNSQTPSTSKYRGETSSLRQERNISKDKTKTKHDLEVGNLLNKCSDIGQSLDTFIKQNTLSSQIPTEESNFALSLAESLARIPSTKKRLILKSKMIVMVAEELED